MVKLNPATPPRPIRSSRRLAYSHGTVVRRRPRPRRRHRSPASRPTPASHGDGISGRGFPSTQQFCRFFRFRRSKVSSHQSTRQVLSQRPLYAVGVPRSPSFARTVLIRRCNPSSTRLVRGLGLGLNRI